VALDCAMSSNASTELGTLCNLLYKQSLSCCGGGPGWLASAGARYRSDRVRLQGIAEVLI
jgi:hypothetical protein